MAFLRRYRALLRRYRALGRRYRALWRRFKVILRRYRARGDIGLFCGLICKAFNVASVTPALSSSNFDACSWCVTFFCGDIGLFCRDIGLFGGDTGLFYGDIGLFCRDIGLFGGKIWLFCRIFCKSLSTASCTTTLSSSDVDVLLLHAAHLRICMGWPRLVGSLKL